MSPPTDDQGRLLLQSSAALVREGVAAYAFRAFAIVPAAGKSQRMGRPKLLLPWGEGTLIDQALAGWKQTAVSAIVVVVRPEDRELAAVCRKARAHVLVPDIPLPHMRDSVQHALAYLAQDYAPRDEDVWLLAPADMPNLSPAIVGELLAAHRPAEPAILTPSIAGRRGHPVLFPWPLAERVALLPADRGIDALHWHSSSRAVPCDHLGIGTEVFRDIDTLEEYERARKRLSGDQ